MTLFRRCSECGATARRHRRHKNRGKRHARWIQHFRAGMGKLARESKRGKRPDPPPEQAD